VFVCLWILPTNFRMPELEPISTAYFINPSHQSVCLYVYPLIVAKQRLGIHVHKDMNTHSKEELLHASFPVWSVSHEMKECGLQSNNGSVSTFPRLWRTAGGIVFFVALVVSYENRLLFLPGTSCFLFMYMIYLMFTFIFMFLLLKRWRTAIRATKPACDSGTADCRPLP
jgi:hypothetical protein